MDHRLSGSGLRGIIRFDNLISSPGNRPRRCAGVRPGDLISQTGKCKPCVYRVTLLVRGHGPKIPEAGIFLWLAGSGLVL